MTWLGSELQPLNTTEASWQDVRLASRRHMIKLHLALGLYPRWALLFLLLLLRSQLDLSGSPFQVRFLHMWPFFNPTIEVVTFRLHGWCILGVFLLPVFTRLGYECQDLLSPCDGMHVCTDYTLVYTLIPKSLGGMESETILTLRKKKSPLPEAQRRFKPATLHHAGQWAQHTTDWTTLALSRTSHVSDIKAGTVEATLPGTWP